MEAAASMIAIAAFSSQSAKVLYETVQGIRDAPEIAKDLLTAIESLQHLLQQPDQLAIHCSSSGHYVAKVVWQPLEKQAQQCSQDLRRMCEKTACLVGTSTHRSLGRAWRRVRTVLNERDIQRMWSGINHHVSVLGVLLEVVNRFVCGPDHAVVLTSWQAKSASPITSDDAY